ncbi:hypothetical protein KSS87_003464 [Heliosperma pusillum]|nr:hypothetical protein KSS87_003464 [Heliosperma pusillum]
MLYRSTLNFWGLRVNRLLKREGAGLRSEAGGNAPVQPDFNCYGVVSGVIEGGVCGLGWWRSRLSLYRMDRWAKCLCGLNARVVSTVSKREMLGSWDNFLVWSVRPGFSTHATWLGLAAFFLQPGPLCCTPPSGSTMDVICRRVPDPLSKIKRLLKKRTSETKSKVKSLKNTTVAVDKIRTETAPKKRKSEASLECPLVKRSKMDHCQTTLTKLMKHKCSMPFLHPVDRDASGDYFQVINLPMDFGTIKRKLQQNKYVDDDEFEGDVKRIFANATLYHPSNNWVHIYATKLSKLFDLLWLSVKPNLTSNTTVIEPGYSTLQAARIAKLPDTILKAPSKIENRTRIDVEAKATELASQIEAEKYKLMKQREQERQAARASLEQMERSITLDDNLGAMRELEALMRCRMQVVCHGNGSSFQLKLGGIRSPLEQLGLFIKPEYQLGYEDDDDLFIKGVVLEDGEILD